MARWKALLLIGTIGALGGLLLWFGLVIVVRCERIDDERVDATVQRCFLGVLPLSTETVPDVTKAGIHVERTRGTGGGYQKRGSTVALELTPRHGPVCRRTQFGPSFGARPAVMAGQIEQFIQEPFAPSLTAWWMPWLVNVCAVPFVLLSWAPVIEILLRALGFFKAET